jgi:hypothetical protein
MAEDAGGIPRDDPGLRLQKLGEKAIAQVYDSGLTRVLYAVRTASRFW